MGVPVEVCEPDRALGLYEDVMIEQLVLVLAGEGEEGSDQLNDIVV